MKYSEVELQAMAAHVVAAGVAGDPRATELVLLLAQHTDVEPSECIRRIKHMARGEFQAAERSEAWA